MGASESTLLADFLTSCEDITDAQRWQRARALGEAAIKESSAKAVIGRLAQGDFYQQRLALIAAGTARDSHTILNLMCGPSEMLFGQAMRIAILVLNDAQFAQVVDRLATKRQTKLVRSLAMAGRQLAVDAMVPHLSLRELPKFLAFASLDIAKTHLVHHREFLCLKDWGCLASFHPDLAKHEMLALLESYNKQTNEDSMQPPVAVDLPYHVQAQLRTVLKRLVQSDPAGGLVILKRVLALTASAHWPIQFYAYRFPTEVADMLLQGPHHTPMSFPPSALRRLDVARLKGLAALGVVPTHWTQSKRLPPHKRLAILENLGETLRGKDGELPLHIVEKMPKNQRQAQARHAVELPAWKGHPEKFLPYLAFLPWDEAAAHSARYFAQPDGAVRALAVASLIGCARYDAARLTDVLNLVSARKNEQDPVRLAMVSAVAALPPSRWEASHLDALQKMIDVALTARDISHATLTGCMFLALKLLPFHPDFSCAQISLLSEKLGSFGTFQAEQRINNAIMVRLEPHLTPLVQAWVQQSRHSAIFGLMRIFGRRLKATPNLLALIKQLTESTKESVATSALGLLLQLRLGQEDDLIMGLLRKDQGWITVNAVQRHLHVKRQDWLTKFLVPRKFKGRFSTGRSSFFPRYTRGFHRWTANQQNLYATTQKDLIDSPKRSTWEIFVAMGTLAEMPSISADFLVHLAGEGTTQPSHREKAIELLGRVDAGKGVPTLLQQLDTQMARIAIYALRHSLLSMPPDEALSQLKSVSMQKVTVAKEVLRLAGELGNESAFGFLSSYARDQTLHVDVRIALFRALWSFLERPEVWDLFERGVHNGPPALARSTISIPQDGLSTTARQHLGRHLALLLQSEDPQVVRETMLRLIAEPTGQTTPQLSDALHQVLQSANVKEVNLAAQALLLNEAPTKPQALAQAACTVTPLALNAIVQAFASQAVSRRAQIAPAAKLLIHHLLDQERMQGLIASLALTCLEGDSLASTFQRLLHRRQLHPGIVEGSTDTLTQLKTRHDHVRLDPLEAALRIQPNIIGRRTGLVVLEALAQCTGWTLDLQNRLAEYQSDPDPWISEAASLIDPPPIA
jgi:hypothetical protein